MNRGMRHVIGSAALAAVYLLQTAPTFAQLPPWAQQEPRRTYGPPPQRPQQAPQQQRPQSQQQQQQRGPAPPQQQARPVQPQSQPPQQQAPPTLETNVA